MYRILHILKSFEAMHSGLKMVLVCSQMQNLAITIDNKN